MEHKAGAAEGLRRNDYFVHAVLRKYMAASIGSMLAASASGMIDTIIVGQFLGETGLAAMSLTAPVYLFYYMIGAVLGIGGSIAANYYIGSNQYERYRSIFTLSCLLTVIMCVVTTIGGLAGLSGIIERLGGSDLAGEYGREYLTYYILLGSGTLLVYIPLNFLKTEGRPATSSWLFLFSGLLNIGLTYLFLSPFMGFGIKGASIATGISMGATACIGFYLLLCGSSQLRFVRVGLFRQSFLEILKAGSPSGAGNLLQALRVMGINHIILMIGARAYLPAFILMKTVSDLMHNVMAGTANAFLPMIGVYYGEKDHKSIRSVLHKAVRSGSILVGIMALLLMLFARPVCSLFNIQDRLVIRSGEQALFCLAAGSIFAFFNSLMTGYFNAIKRPLLSNLILVLRLLCYLLGPAYILAGRMGIGGIWGSHILAEVMTFLTMLLVVFWIGYRHPQLDRYCLNNREEDMAEISFSVRNQLDDVIFASTKISDFCAENHLNERKSMQVALALEEMLTVLISYCMDTQREQFIDIRIKKVEEDIMIRIRSSGRIFNPIQYYEENKNNQELFEQLLGIKLIISAAKSIAFSETFGANNLLIYF